MKLTFDVPEEIAEKIAEDIKAAVKDYKKQKTWPQDRDEFYCIQGSTEIAKILFFSTDDYSTKALKIGNCFKTKEEAKFKLEQLKVLHELEQLADDDQSWYSNQCKHYYLEYNYDTNDVELDYGYSLKQNVSYFKSEESAQKAIDKIGKDRLKKYYFCIPEE